MKRGDPYHPGARKEKECLRKVMSGGEDRSNRVEMRGGDLTGVRDKMII